MVPERASETTAPVDFWCVAAEPRSVESRFGLRDCLPRGEDSHCTVDLGKWSLQPDGRVQAGALAIAADHITGEVPFLRRQPGHYSLTTELTIDFAAVIEPDATLHLEGRPVRIEQGSGFAQATMTGADGSVAAFASTRTVYVPESSGAGEGVWLAAPRETDSAAVTIDEHLQFECSYGDGTAEVRLEDSSAWVNDFGILHGGVWACLAEVAASRLIGRANPDLATATVHTTYLRPGGFGAALAVSARSRHVGARLAIAECVGQAADGTICTLSTVTARRVGNVAATGQLAVYR